MRIFKLMAATALGLLAQTHTLAATQTYQITQDYTYNNTPGTATAIFSIDSTPTSNINGEAIWSILSASMSFSDASMRFTPDLDLVNSKYVQVDYGGYSLSQYLNLARYDYTITGDYGVYGIGFLPGFTDPGILGIISQPLYGEFQFGNYFTRSRSTLMLSNFNMSQVSAVPEPESYAMLALGLGVLGLMGRRKAKVGQLAA
jgi:hypothetical protein